MRERIEPIGEGYLIAVKELHFCGHYAAINLLLSTAAARKPKRERELGEKYTPLWPVFSKVDL